MLKYNMLGLEPTNLFSLKEKFLGSIKKVVNQHPRANKPLVIALFRTANKTEDTATSATFPNFTCRQNCLQLHCFSRTMYTTSPRLTECPFLFPYTKQTQNSKTADLCYTRPIDLAHCYKKQLNAVQKPH